MVLTAVNQILEVFLSRHFENYCETQGHKAKNLLRTVIYKKFSTISQATNKVYQEGQIIELINTDASKAEEIFDMVSGLCKLPVNFLFTIAMLWSTFGVSFFISLLPFGLSFVINKHLSKKRK